MSKQYNWKQVAEDAGYANANTANAVWGALRKKIITSDGDGAAKPSPKRKMNGVGGDGMNEESEPSPTKKRKQGAGSNRKKSAKAVQGDAEGGEVKQEQDE